MSELGSHAPELQALKKVEEEDRRASDGHAFDGSYR